VFFVSGDEEARTLNPLLAKQVLSQLSYIPVIAGPLGAAGSGRTKIRTWDLVVISDAL
jgi:hypothetical protein